jgi:hypothetical protein
MSQAPEECSRRIVKDSDELKSTGDEVNEGVCNNQSSDGTTDIHSSGDSLLRDKFQQVSQLINKPVNDSTNVHHLIGDNNQQIDGAVQGMCLIRVGVADPDQAQDSSSGTNIAS